MLRLDRNDPLDRMILKELSGKVVSFDEWLDAMEELGEEPGCEEILQKKGLRREAVLRNAKAFRADFLSRLAGQGLPVDDRFELCRLLCEKVQDAPSEQLLRIYSEILSDPGFLLNSEPQPAAQADDEEQMILQYLDFSDEQPKLLQTLLQRRALAEQFAEVEKQKRSPRPVSCDTERKYEVFQCFTARFDLPSKGNGQILLNNLEAYMQITAASPVLKSVEPLLLFRLLTRRQSYMCNTPDLSVNLAALWKPDSNKIDADNGRNFKQYRKNLQFFTELCQIYEKDRPVSLPLCWYGLDRITVLGDFYRNEISGGWEYADNSGPRFPATVGEIVENSPFTCFENGYGDNVVLEDSGVPVRDMVRFQYSENPVIIRSLNKISAYMNNHAVELTDRFLQADAQAVKTLCRSILEHSRIKGVASAHELSLYLASINSGLMDLEDYFAQQYLTQAGEAMTAPSREIQDCLNDI